RRGDRAAALEAYLELAECYRGTLDGRHKGEAWRPGIVLDPFCGTGTTLLVATRLGRDAIGIDLDAKNVPLVVERVGMHLESVEVAGPAHSTGTFELAGSAR
ncbi:MAG: DNA methyltransferase, partial [Acidimicrobiales bacterium]